MACEPRGGRGQSIFYRLIARYEKISLNLFDAAYKPLHLKLNKSGMITKILHIESIQKLIKSQMSVGLQKLDKFEG